MKQLAAKMLPCMDLWGRLEMQVRTDTSQLLLQLQAREKALDNNQKMGASQKIVDLTSSSSVKEPQGSVFDADPLFTPTFESVARYTTEDVYERRDVIKTQDVFETRAVYEEQEVLETKVVGTQDLSEFASVDEAGIERRARFSITVGDGSTAVVKFNSARKITVKVDGVVEEFRFGAKDGSFRFGLQEALNSIEGISASYTDQGKLSIEAADGNTLSIFDVRNSPLQQLGLAEGVIDASVVGYQQVQVGTEQVKVGDEEIVTGSETVKVGNKQVLDGYDRELTGLERVDSASAIIENLLMSDQNHLEDLFGAIQANVDSESVQSLTDSLPDDAENNKDAPEAEPATNNWAAQK